MSDLGYKQMLAEANSYYNTIVKAINGNKFNTELLFNILSMSTEKYFVALLMYKNFMPHNHTITELVADMKEHYSLKEEITTELIKIDEFLHICAIDSFIQKIPTKSEMEKLFYALKALKEFSDKTIQDKNAA